jgi:hypothetical protein
MWKTEWEEVVWAIYRLSLPRVKGEGAFGEVGIAVEGSELVLVILRRRHYH